MTTVDLDVIEQLLALMDRGGLTELHYVQGETEIRLSRQRESPAPAAPAVPAAAAAPAAAPAAGEAPGAAAEAEGEFFRSPMVGTWYSRPNPDSDPYVSAGDAVDPDAVLCIIEAMKVFNEIKAEFRGRIEEVLVQDGETVEYDQPLFRISKG